MPPKSGSGKKKLSKADKERLKKEEADRKLQEEEDAKRQQELEEKQRKMKEKQEVQERMKVENEERRIRKEQMSQLMERWNNSINILADEDSRRRVDAKWDRYMKCDGSPNPTIPGEINTYLNLWMEDDQHNDIDSVLEESKLTLSLIAELEFLIEDTPKEDMTDKTIATYRETIDDLQLLLRKKLDLATHSVLLKATDKRDSETSNLQQVMSDGVITLCVWGNLSKNPRIKSFEFPEQGITFDIPRLLRLNDCAYRVLITKFDHFSNKCSSFHARIKKKAEEVVTEEPVEEEKPAEEEKKEDAEGEEGVDRETTEDLMASLRQANKDENEEPKEEEPIKEEEEVVVEMEDDYDIKTPEPDEFEDFDGDEDAVDLRGYHVLGGIFHFDLLHLPPQPKVANSWIITEVVEPAELEHMHYIADPPAVASSAGKENEKKEKQQEEGQKKEERPPIGIQLKLPKDVYFCEEPQVAYWHAETSMWRLDGFTDSKFDEENRVLSIKTNKFGTMCLLQDAHINMPFQSWELRPRATNHAKLTIIAAIVEVEIDIKDGMCCLTQPETNEELGHLLNQWMKPQDFILAMKKAGLNLFPDIDSSKYVSIQNKNPVAENALYQQMALTASSMAYSWSKWNNEMKEEQKILVQTAEQLEDEPLLEEVWQLLLVTKKCAKKLKMTEFDEVFSEEQQEALNFHSNLYNLVQDTASEKAMERINQSDFKFIHAVYQLLSATKLVTYS